MAKEDAQSLEKSLKEEKARVTELGDHVAIVKA